MSENLKKFLELLASDKELEAKALACNELDEEKGKEEPEIENGGVIKIIGIAAAVLLPVAIISLLVARRKK